MILRRLIFALILTCVTTVSAKADEITSAVKTLQSVEPGGKGTAAAREAAELLANAGMVIDFIIPSSFSFEFMSISDCM